MFLEGVIISLSEIEVLLVLAAASDVRKGKIPNILVLLGISIGLTDRVGSAGLEGLLTFCVDILLPILLLYVFYLIHGIGAGDIKLFSMIFAMLGRSAGFNVMAFSFFIAAIEAVRRALIRRKTMLPEEDEYMGRKLPLAPFILAGYTLWRIGFQIWCVS